MEGGARGVFYPPLAWLRGMGCPAGGKARGISASRGAKGDISNERQQLITAPRVPLQSLLDTVTGISILTAG